MTPRWYEPGIRAYPPTQTMTFMRCPRRWVLSKDWEQRGQWTPNRLAGQAIHAGAAQQSTLAARHVLEQGWPLGHGEHDLEATWAAVGRGLKKLLAIDPPLVPVGVDWQKVEACLDHDHLGVSEGPPQVPGECAITDLVYSVKGQVTLVDLKTKLVGGENVAQAEWRMRHTLDELPHDWQLLDYAWRLWRDSGILPSSIRKVIVSCSPILVREAEIPVTEPMLAQWERAAARWWGEMATAGHPEPWIGMAGAIELPTLSMEKANYTACEDFGGCPFKLLCHDLYGDLEQAGNFYERRVR